MIDRHGRGRWGERLAVLALRLRGYGIVARGFAIGRQRGAGEVDIIARRGRVLAFVEVKRRADLSTAMAAITPRQQQRIVRSAQAFVARNPHYAQYDIRFDAVLVIPWHWPRHIPDAWSGV